MASDGINLTHQFLIAMPGMLDGHFAGSVVYLCEHNAQGAMGLVINKPTDITLGSLFEKVDLSLPDEALAAQPVFFGGPVQTERGFVLHEPLGADTPGFASTLAVPDGLAMTTSKDVLESVAAGHGPQRLLVTLGYSGWGAGQLEDEIGRNGWLTVPADAALVFDTPIEQRYQRAMQLLGVDPRMLSQEAGHA
ncbi:YqgE/AlgH family protein [Ideonella sp. 4Y16]|uniref:YqgE/AlgH family protein n=1 Tax=Ideonella alba TaxID=2824118 RepID=UPI001B393A2D|nr:YqgE/AlgH family protein [Ideonella alba]MBQ0945268.1 YqgE/AlgH family protein [Ideonella alba]